MKLEKLKIKKKTISKEEMVRTTGGRQGTIQGDCYFTAATGCFDCSGTADTTFH